MKYQTDPNSFIHFLYYSNGTACAEDFVFMTAFSKSSIVIGPGLGICFGSAASLQFILSKSNSYSIAYISLLSGFIAASLLTSLTSLPEYPYKQKNLVNQ